MAGVREVDLRFPDGVTRVAAARRRNPHKDG